jgi:hypothetical protein
VIVNATGLIRQEGEHETPRRYLTIVAGTPAMLGVTVQVQVP